MGVWVDTLSMARGPEPERLGLAGATGVGNEELVKWPSSELGLLNVK